VTQALAYTYDPIMGERELSRFSILEPREAAEPGVALVLLQDGSGLQAIRGTRRLTAGEILWGRIRRIYRVDMTEHALEWQSWLNSEHDEWVLLAHTQLRCVVSNPQRVVEENVRDAYRVLEPLLAERMRETAAEYGFRDRGKAEQMITSSLRQHSNLSEFFNLRWIGVRLYLDQTVMEQKRRSLESGFYLDHLKKGRWSALALQLAHDPGAINTVVQQIMQQHGADMALQLEALKVYLDKGAKDGYQLEAPANEILQLLAGTWQAAMGALPMPDTGGPSGTPGDPPTDGSR
jgi:hypothetical protein